MLLGFSRVSNMIKAMPLRDFLDKLFVALYNLIPIDINKVKNINEFNQSGKNLVVIIDYENFSSRKYKKIGNTSYKCGTDSVTTILEYCIKHKLDYIYLITTDDEKKSVSHPEINGRTFLINQGTDIAALKKISNVFSGYSFVTIANSSCAYVDALRFDEILDDNLCPLNIPFIIGFNANCKISPSILTYSNKYPHIITNFFRTRSKELLEVLYAENNHFYPFANYGFRSKYFAIRNFEILLSAWVLHNHGELTMLSDKNLVYPKDRSLWPKKDTRLTRF